MSKKVLITGISGFIAKHVTISALKKGYHIRGTVRDISKTEALKNLLIKHGADPLKLEFVQANLDQEEGWKEAVDGVDDVLHVASPFPLQQPKGSMDLVPSARGGTLRVLNALKEYNPEVQKIVVTSSMVAMMYRANRPAEFPVNEHDWTDHDWKLATPYIISKTLAEKSAWDWAKQNGYTDRLTVINPGFVLGPALDNKIATSMEVMKLLFAGAYPAVPPVYFPVVDVRDLAELHVTALTSESGGRRLIGSADSLSMAGMGKILKEAFPKEGKKIPTGELPAFLVKLLSNFDASLKTVLPDLKVIPQANSEYVTELTGVKFRPAKEAVIAAGQSLIDLKAL